MQVGLVGTEGAVPAVVRDEQLLGGGRRGVAADGLAVHAQQLGDLLDLDALVVQLMDGGVSRAGVRGALALQARIRRVGLGFGQAGAVRQDALLDRLGEVLPQVEAVCDLYRVGGGGADGLGIGTGRSRQTISMPGCFSSQDASVSAVRSGRTSTGRPVSMSIRIVP